ncbi:hypothetical protein B7494_g5900 [Chlorociboria aeruginascens]|nr:hypothetical protein B7494_g5900 [Chlorociboria aeruginascens]
MSNILNNPSTNSRQLPDKRVCEDCEDYSCKKCRSIEAFRRQSLESNYDNNTKRGKGLKTCKYNTALPSEVDPELGLICRYRSDAPTSKNQPAPLPVTEASGSGTKPG